MKKILGLDLGTTTVGIAMTDSLCIAAHGVETFHFEMNNFKKARIHIHEIIQNEGIEDVVLGVPYYASGDLSPHAKSCLRFKEDLLKENPGIKVHEVDESYSTIEADEKLKLSNLSYEKRKKIIDEMAAVVILERYLQAKEK